MRNPKRNPTTARRQYIDHDGMFKELLGSDIEATILTIAPDLHPHVDWSSVEVLPLEVYIDNLANTEAKPKARERAKKRVLDILVKVKFRGQDAFFLNPCRKSIQTIQNHARKNFLLFLHSLCQISYSHLSYCDLLSR